MGRDNNQPHSGKTLLNESKHPYIVELAAPMGELDVELSRQIVAFHKSWQIEPRHGRRTFIEGQNHFRWCFSDLETARAFIERFGGNLCNQFSRLR
jgi:hypothetical protein